MKVKADYIILILTVILLSGCSATKVVSDFDGTEDFTQFKTYEFAGWANDSDQLLNRFDRERIEQAFVEEGRKRGMEPVKENGDVIVSLFITAQQRTQQTAHTTSTGTMMGGPRMGRRGMGAPGWGWGMGHSTTVINETEYLEGSLMIEMYDVEDQKLIWQAIGTKTISDNPQKRAQGIPKKVAAIMRKYPVKPQK